MSTHLSQVGTVIAEKYRVERVLGEGGMGIVLAVRHLELQELVALKLISNDVSSNAVLLERFRREARAMMRIKSEHVVRTYDIGRLEDGTPYMVMEYLEGQDLSRRLEERGPFAPSLAVDFVMQACDALAHAHSLGIVHRDLKPSNLFVVRRPDGRECLKVIDFGIAKQSGFGETASGLSLTRTAQVVGSPRYMAPEQMSSAKTVDARADIWSLGVTLFELLSGHAPFEGKTLISLYKDITASEPPSLLRYRPDLPEGVASVVQRCMHKDREQRFRSVAELSAALKPFASPQCLVAPEQLAIVLGQTPQGAFTSIAPDSTTWQQRGPQPLTGPGSTQHGFGSTVASGNRHVGGWLLLALLFSGVVGGSVVFAARMFLSSRRNDVNVVTTVAQGLPLGVPSSPNPTGTPEPKVVVSPPQFVPVTVATATVLRTASVIGENRPRSLPSVEPRSVPTAPNSSAKPAVPDEPATQRLPRQRVLEQLDPE